MKLAGQLQNELEHPNPANPAVPDGIKRKILEYRTRADVLYRNLVGFVLRIFKEFVSLQDINRSIFLNQTRDMFVEFRKIVDYRNRSAKTILSSWSGYDKVWKGANDIVLLELRAQFAYLHRQRIERLTNAASPDRSVLTYFCKQYNALFRVYKNIDIQDNNYYYNLTGHYMRFLKAMLVQGESVYPVIQETSYKNWPCCLNMVNQLLHDGYVAEDIKQDWMKTMEYMKRICRTSDDIA